MSRITDFAPAFRDRAFSLEEAEGWMAARWGKAPSEADEVVRLWASMGRLVRSGATYRVSGRLG